MVFQLFIETFTEPINTIAKQLTIAQLEARDTLFYIKPLQELDLNNIDNNVFAKILLANLLNGNQEACTGMSQTDKYILFTNNSGIVPKENFPLIYAIKKYLANPFKEYSNLYKEAMSWSLKQINTDLAINNRERIKDSSVQEISPSLLIKKSLQHEFNTGMSSIKIELPAINKQFNEKHIISYLRYFYSEEFYKLTVGQQKALLGPIKPLILCFTLVNLIEKGGLDSRIIEAIETFDHNILSDGNFSNNNHNKCQLKYFTSSNQDDKNENIHSDIKLLEFLYTNRDNPLFFNNSGNSYTIELTHKTCLLCYKLIEVYNKQHQNDSRPFHIDVHGINPIPFYNWKITQKLVTENFYSELQQLKSDGLTYYASAPLTSQLVTLSTMASSNFSIYQAPLIGSLKNVETVIEAKRVTKNKLNVLLDNLIEMNTQKTILISKTEESAQPLKNLESICKVGNKFPKPYYMNLFKLYDEKKDTIHQIDIIEKKGLRVEAFKKWLNYVEDAINFKEQQLKAKGVFNEYKQKLDKYNEVNFTLNKIKENYSMLYANASKEYELITKIETFLNNKNGLATSKIESFDEYLRTFIENSKIDTDTNNKDDNNIVIDNSEESIYQILSKAVNNIEYKITSGSNNSDQTSSQPQEINNINSSLNPILDFVDLAGSSTNNNNNDLYQDSTLIMEQTK